MGIESDNRREVPMDWGNRGGSGSIGPRQAAGTDEVSRLLRDLKADNWHVRQAAVRQIGSITDPALLEDLLARLAGERWYVREAAAAGIRGLTCSSLGPILVKAMTQGDDILINAVTCALGCLRYREAEPLLEQAASDPDCRVRRSARTALERIRDSA